MESAINYDIRYDGPTTGTSSKLGESVVFGDFDGDGKDDLAMGAMGTDYNSETDDPELLQHFTTKVGEFFRDVDNVTTFSEIPNPSLVNTGPFQTVANESETEQETDNGTFREGIGTLIYNYVTEAWEER